MKAINFKVAGIYRSGFWAPWKRKKKKELLFLLFSLPQRNPVVYTHVRIAADPVSARRRRISHRYREHSRRSARLLSLIFERRLSTTVKFQSLSSWTDQRKALALLQFNFSRHRQGLYIQRGSHKWLFSQSDISKVCMYVMRYVWRIAVEKRWKCTLYRNCCITADYCIITIMYYSSLYVVYFTTTYKSTTKME